MTNKYIYSIWRRKTASAQIRLFTWNGQNTINWKEISSYINRKDLFDIAFLPIKICWQKDNVYFEVKVNWSWVSAQVQAIKHGLSRALSSKDDSNKKLLRDAWLLTRDDRKVERKKPGKKKARKSPSWSKR